MTTSESSGSSASRLLARLAWIVPILLFLLSVYEFKVSRDLERTAREGVEAVADVMRYERADRKDITQAELDLLVHMPDGSSFSRTHLSLPYSIAHRVEQDTLHVRVLLGSGQEIIIASIVGTQRRIALSNSAMSLIAALIALAGVVAWNRYLNRTPHIDPPTNQIE